MDGLLNQYLDQIKIGGKQVYKNLALFPLLAPESGEPDYLTMEEALREEAVVITEVSEGGQVPELKLVNLSESKILILDGRSLKGPSRTGS